VSAVAATSIDLKALQLGNVALGDVVARSARAYPIELSPPTMA
jgi:hypothetical protein